MGNCQGAKINGPNVVRSRHAGKQIKKYYKVSKDIIGKGAFAKVYMGHSIANPGLKVAVKIINKLYLGEEDLNAIGDEVQSLQTLDHPNIVKYYETYEDSRFMFIITEFWKGTTLGHQLKQKKKYSELDTAHILNQLISAICHCHFHNVSHRDIKPDNVMIDKDLNVTLIDFGLSKLTTKGHLKSVIGSPLYMSPEVFNGKYNNKCDIWSLGVLIYHLICGHLPFKGNSLQEVMENAKNKKLSFKNEVWKSVSPSWIDLIENMIVVNPAKRYSAEKVIDHHWFDILKESFDEGATVSSSKTILESIRNYYCDSDLKKTWLHMLAKMIKRKDLKELNREFEYIDQSQDGVITFKELKKALNICEIDISDSEIKSIISHSDFSDNNTINYTEFLIMTLDQSKFTSEDSINSLIKNFDRDEKGYITKTDISCEFSKAGKSITKSQLKNIMKMHDPSKRGYITYSEFKDVIINS